MESSEVALSTSDRLRRCESRLIDCEDDLRLLMEERAARSLLVLRVKLAVFAAVTILSAYLATVHGWWAP